MLPATISAGSWNCSNVTSSRGCASWAEGGSGGPVPAAARGLRPGRHTPASAASRLVVGHRVVAVLDIATEHLLDTGAAEALLAGIADVRPDRAQRCQGALVAGDLDDLPVCASSSSNGIPSTTGSGENRSTCNSTSGPTCRRTISIMAGGPHT